jgi:serine protease Do
MTLRDSPGMRIDGVTPGSAADKAGLKPDDILLNLNNTPINSVEDLQEVYNRHKPGDSATAIIQRGNSKLTLQLTFSRRQSPT